MMTQISLKTVRWMVWGCLGSLMMAIMTLSQVTLARADGPTIDLFGPARDVSPFPYITPDIVLGDVDGNGTLDIIHGNSEGASMVHFNDGHANFTEGQPFGGKKRIGYFTLGDLDGDGMLDFIGQNEEQEIVIYWNDKKGNFKNEQSIDPKTSKTSFAVGDINGNGTLDIVVGIEGQESKIYWNDGRGNFTDGQIFGDKDGATDMALGDLDGDNTLDLVVRTENSTKIYWNKDGHFIAGQSIKGASSSGFRPFVIGDWDSDGFFDIIDNEYFYRNDRDGTFKAKQYLDAKNVIGTALGDIDGNGILDLMVTQYDYANFKPAPTNIYLNGDFENKQPFGTINDPLTNMVFGDLDGNGSLDLVSSSYGTIKVHLNNQSGFKKGPYFNYPSYAGGVFSVSGDLDGNGLLDVMFSNTIYLNNGSGRFKKQFMEAIDPKGGRMAIALGDLNGNGSLDIIVRSLTTSIIYLNDHKANFNEKQRFDFTERQLLSVALGDLDGNGSLDFFDDGGHVYLNDGQANFKLGQSWGKEESKINNIDGIGDLDGDGSLDLVLTAQDDNSHEIIYFNDGQANFEKKQIFGSREVNDSNPLGDVDGNGSLDLIISHFYFTNLLYFNDGQENFKLKQALEYAPKTVFGDFDNNGSLDIVANVNGIIKIYPNDGDGNFNKGQPFGEENSVVENILLGDLDGNGSLDIIIGHQAYLSGYTATHQIPNDSPNVVISTTNQANGYATSKVFNQRYIPITYTLFDDNPIGQIQVTYSLNGGGQWLPAIASNNTITTNLVASLYPTRTITNTHVFTWDTLASGVFGRFDNIVVKIKACSQPAQPGAVGSFKYYNAVGGLYQRACATTTSYPFRVQGSQVRVMTGTQPISGAIVYRKPIDSDEAALPMAAMNQVPFTTDANGNLQGRGTLALSDTLVALVPVSATHYYTLYHTSAKPTTDGLEAHTISQAGVQTLTIKATQPLYLLNMTVSLEWDASHDKVYMAELQRNIQRASEILYDLTNGGMALGPVKIYQAKEHWDEVNVVIYASNGVRPHADLGGFVALGEVITDVFNKVNERPQVITYTHGQVQLGAVWGRYGNTDGNLSEDWARVLAHELGHYYMTLLDNYLGINNDQIVVPIECPGSTMASPYQDDDSEFLMDWLGCPPGGRPLPLMLKNTQRTEWNQIIHRFPDLAPLKPLKQGDKPGPNTLPLQVTQIEMITPTSTATLLNAPFFNLKNQAGGAIFPENGQAKGYLIKTNGNKDMRDDVVVELGSPTQDTLLARGAAVNDDICLFDYSQPLTRFGCQTITTTTASRLTLYQAPDWPPYIIITPESTYTYVITAVVSSKVYSRSTFYAQLMPDVALPYTSGRAITVTLNRSTVNMYDEAVVFTQTISSTQFMKRGFARIWVDSSEPLTRQVISQFSIEGGWPGACGNYYCRRYYLYYQPRLTNFGSAADFRRYRHGAPIYSDDGGIAIFNTDDLQANVGGFVQNLSDAPDVPPWLTPVGQSYRVLISPTIKTGSVLFSYFERDVPFGQEDWLAIYAYTPSIDPNAAWQRLTTTQSITRNLAAAKLVPNAQIYALMSTVPIPLKVGWNNFGYLNPASQGIITAMASISDAYTAVYGYNSTTQQWQLFDKNVFLAFSNALSINTLTNLEFGRGYWVNVTKSITLYFATDVNGSANPPRPLSTELWTNANFPAPPVAFYYGEITSPNGTTPTLKIQWGACSYTPAMIRSKVPNKFIYQQQLMSSTECKNDNNIVTFYLDSRNVYTKTWSNTQANRVDLPVTKPTSPSGCDIVINGNMENDTAWRRNIADVEARFVAGNHDGRSLVLALPPSRNNQIQSTVRQLVTLPSISNNEKLVLSFDYQLELIGNLPSNDHYWSVLIFGKRLPGLSVGQGWQVFKEDIPNSQDIAKQSVTLQFEVGSSTTNEVRMFVDNVKICKQKN